MRKLSIDIADLLMAFEDNSDETDWRLDLESGQTVAIDEETRFLLNEYFDESDVEEGEDGRAAFEKWLAGRDCPDWQKDDLRQAYEIETQEARFTSIPSDESRDAYNDMVYFAHTVEDERLQELLSVALNGRGAFRRFKYDITELPETMIHEVMDAIFHPAGQDVLTPKDLTPATGNVIHYEARWQPPDDYIMQLRTKRIMTDKIMTAAEWEIWEHVFAKKYDELGGKPPSFIKGATIIQVPGTRH